MASKRKEDWIYVMTPEGEKKIASPAYVRKLFGDDVSVNLVRARVSILERKIEKLESPERQQAIIDALYGKGKHNRLWLVNRVDYIWYDLTALIKKGIILETKSGTQTMYEFPE